MKSPRCPCVAGFTSLRRELGLLPGAPHPQEESLSRAIGAGLLHLDDPDRLRATTTAQLCGTGKRWRPLPDALDLLWQAPPSGSCAMTPPGPTAKACSGTKPVPFSPSTRTRDVALGPSLFHWESQSTTTAASPTGQRTIHHEARGSRVLLFVREHRREGGRSRRGGGRGWGWRFEGGRVRRERLVTSMLLPLFVAPKLIGKGN